MPEFRTNPGDRSVSELEREVDRERERVSATIDELQARASLGNLVEEIVKAVGENGGEISRNLGRSLRDNPLPALLTGVGLAWLMASSGRPRQNSGRWNDPYEDYRRHGARDHSPQQDYEAVGAPEFGPDQAGPGEQDRGPGLGERVSEAVDAAREGAVDTAEGISRRVVDTLGGLREEASDLSHSTRARLSETAHRVRHSGHSARRRAEGASGDLRQGLDALIEEQPLVLGAIAMAIGAAIGGALPRSRAEDRMFGAQSDRAVDTVRSLAEDQGRKVQATAKAVAEEALHIADETAADLGSQLPRGEDIVDSLEGRTREAATRLRDAGAVEANPGDPERSRSE